MLRDAGILGSHGCLDHGGLGNETENGTRTWKGKVLGPQVLHIGTNERGNQERAHGPKKLRTHARVYVE